MANLLADATSPYLRQHAENPVHWRPWGPEAFAEARRRDVPVFVSIGYSSCHWCHVMAHESFEDEQTAAQLNAGFVAVKVDREEHPDVDDAYMSATQLLTGQGGWPMSVFATGDGRPFHAGTYHPPEPRELGSGTRVPSFREVLTAVTEAWTGRRAEVEQAAARLAGEVGRQSNRMAAVALGARAEDPVRYPRPDAGPAPAAHRSGPAGAGESDGLAGPAADPVVAGAVAALRRMEDPEHGGFSASGPKFPPSPALGFLLQVGAMGEGTGGTSGTSGEALDLAALDLAARTLTAMGTSALVDPVTGGVARYATDRAWALPHFERMLPDNAQLLRWSARWAGIVEARQAAPARLARRMALGIARWLEGAMTTPSGALASALDADTAVGTRHIEGYTSTWAAGELREVLGTALAAEGVPDAELSALAQVLTGAPVEAGDGRYTLHAGRLLTEREQELWDRALPAVRRHVSARPQPDRDGKEVAAWNGMAVVGLVEAWALLGEDPGVDDLLDRALRIGEVLWAVHCEAGAGAEAGPEATLRLHRTALQGRPGPADGTLADHAHVADGFLALHRATGAPRWKARARAVVEAVVGRLVVTTDHGPALLSAPTGDAAIAAAQGGPAYASPLDGAEPSAIGTWADVLLQWQVLAPQHAATLPGGGAGPWARSLLVHTGDLGEQLPLETATALRLRARAGRETDLLVVAGGTGAERRTALGWAILRGVVAVVGPGAGDGAAQDEPDPDDVTAGRTSRDGTPALYLCHGTLCHAPVAAPGDLDELVGQGPSMPGAPRT